jgi:hypothetical protein
MAILRFGNKIGLTGDDARLFLMETWRTTLPTTIAEYNQALEEAISEWRAEGSPEGRLLSNLLEGQMLSDDGNSDGRESLPTSQETNTEPALYFRNQNSGRIKFTALGLEQYLEDFRQVGIEIEAIQTEEDFERARLESVRYSTIALMLKLLDYPALNAAFKPFVSSLKAQLKQTKDE